MDRPKLRLVIWSAGGVAVLAITYLAMVRLGVGQWLDHVSIEGRKSTRLAARRFATLLIRALTPALMAIGGAGVIWFAARRRGRLAAVASAAAVIATPVISRVLKEGLPRSDLGHDLFLSPVNTYPSGHSAAAMVVTLMAVSVATPLWRPRVAGVGAVAVVMHTVGMAGSGWHRPSDLIGGMALAVAIAGLASIPLVSSWHGTREVLQGGWIQQRGWVVGAGLLGATAPMVWYVPIRLLGTSSYGSFKAHLAAALVTCAAAAAAVVLHARLVGAADVAAMGPGSGCGEE